MTHLESAPQPNGCPSFTDTELEAAVGGILHEERAEQLSAHLELCPYCQSRMNVVLEMTAGQNQADEALLDEPDSTADSILSRLNISPPAIADYQPGDLIGHYRVIGLLGKGGSSTVYDCHDEQLARRVAVKVLTGQTYQNTLLARHEREARLLAQLDHPWIVKAYEIKPLEFPPYIVMELVAGGSSSRLITARPLNPSQAARLVAGVAGAVHHAHEQGIVHRDIKPSNLLVVRPYDQFQPLPDDLSLKVSDFGLARPLGGDSRLTSTNAIIGTPAYMSPEQSLGRQIDIGPASDIYSLGVVLYEYLVGRPPLLADTAMATLRMINEVDTLPPRRLQPGIPLDLDTICMKCLRKNPAERYETARQLAEDLQRFLEGRPIMARPLGRVQRIYRWCKRNRLPAALLGGIMVLVSSLVALAVTFAIMQKDLRQKAEAAAMLSKQAAQEASNEGDFARSLLISGFRSLDGFVEQLNTVKNLDLLPAIAEKAKVFNQEMIRQYAIRVQLTRELHGDAIDKHFREAITFRTLGYNANADQIFQQLVALGKSLSTSNPDYARARDAAIKSATLLAIDLLQSGQSEETVRFLQGLQTSLAFDYSTQNLNYMEMIIRLSYLNTLIKALRAANQPAEANALQIQRSRLMAAILASPENPQSRRKN